MDIHPDIGQFFYSEKDTKTFKYFVLLQ